jgi:uncharacterized membrane protein YfcA
MLSVIGVGVGVIVSNAVSQRTLELGFAALMIVVAAQLIARALRGGRNASSAQPETGG